MLWVSLELVVPPSVSYSPMRMSVTMVEDANLNVRESLHLSMTERTTLHPLTLYFTDETKGWQ